MSVQDGPKYVGAKTLELVEIVEQCVQAISLVQADSEPRSASEATRAGYLALAQSLLRRAESTDGGLTSVIQNTTRSNTFYKRVAALHYHCALAMSELGKALPQAINEAVAIQMLPSTKALLEQIQALATLKQQGLIQPRRKRSSKRQALRGLPPDWRTTLCKRGANGKYGLALLVSALTGARPNELEKGIDVWKSYDNESQKELICFDIRGAKVTAHQGQSNRIISYALDDDNPLVYAMVQHMHDHSVVNLRVEIKDSGNFTVEIRRLAQRQWPNHKHAITAYCFRHQWSADLKAAGDADAVSKGLGHSSAKTRRYYGTANQASSGDRLKPIRIEAQRPVKGLSSLVLPDPNPTIRHS